VHVPLPLPANLGMLGKKDLYLYVYKCICIYLCVFAYIYIFIHICLHRVSLMYINVYVYTCVCICIYIYIHTHIFASCFSHVSREYEHAGGKENSGLVSVKIKIHKNVHGFFEFIYIHVSI